MISKDNEKQTKKMLFLSSQLILYYFSNFPCILYYLVCAASELQFITYLWSPIYEEQFRNQFSDQINYEVFIVYLSRPDEFLNIQFFRSEYYYLICLSCLVLFYVAPMISLQLEKSKQKLKKDTIARNENMVALYWTMCSYFLQILIPYFLIPFLTIFIDGITISQRRKDSIGAINILFIVISIFILFFATLLNLLLCRETIDLKNFKFQKLNQTFLDYIQLILQCIQILVYGLITIQKNGIILQSCLIFIISLIKIIQIFQFEYSDQILINISAIISSYGLVFSIVSLIDTVFQNQYTLKANVIIVLVFLIFCKMLIAFYNQIENTILITIIGNKNHFEIKYFLTKFANKQFSTQQYLFVKALIINWGESHIKEYHSQEINHYSITSQKYQIQQQYLDRFLHKKFSQFVKKIQKNKGYDLHLIALMQTYDLSSLALRSIDQLLSNSMYIVKSKGFLNDSENPSLAADSLSKQDFNKTISSKSNKSHQEEVQKLSLKHQEERNKLFFKGKFNLSIFEIARANLLKGFIKLNLQNKFFENQKTKSQISDVQLGVQIFLKNEKRNMNLRNSIIEVLIQKNQFLQQFTNKKSIDTSRLYKQAMKLSEQELKLEEKLNQRYLQFPSHKLQSILVFYQAEILNNYIEAYKNSNLTSMPDEQLINMDANIKSTFFTKKVVYLSIILEDNQHLIIQRRSENSLKFFMISQENQKHFWNIDFILPEAIKNEHNLLVQKFLSTSVSKFYLNSNQTFFKVNNIIVKTCQLIFDIHFDSVSHYRFSAFFSESITQSAYILVDINQNIGGITQSFFEKIGYDASFIDKLSIWNGSKIPIDFILPNFQNLNQSKIQSAFTELRFLKENYFFQNDELYERKLTKTTQQSSFWSQIDKLYIFDVEIIINYQDIYGYNYYIIEIKDIRQVYTSKKSLGFNSSKCQTIEKQIFEISELSEIEAEVNSPRALVLEQKQNVSFYNDSLFLKKSQQIELFSPKRDLDKSKFEKDQLENIAYSIQQEQQILSPNGSNIHWQQDTSQLPFKNSFQQDYFNKDKNLSLSQYESKNNQLEGGEEQDDSQQKRNIQDNNELKLKQIKQDEQLSSSNNAMKGIKKSKLYKKYEMINQLSQPSFPLTLKLFILFQTTTYILILIYFIIYLVGVSTDLTRFIGEIDMIQLHAGVMGPHDLYLQMRQTIFTYQGFVSAGKLSTTDYQTLSDPLYNNIAIGYYEFKNGFVEWLTNPYLTPFFKDRNITVYFLKYNATQTYPYTYHIREGMSTVLTYYYDFKLRFEARLSPANTTYQIFQFANVYTLHYWFEDLTVEVWNYSKDRSDQTKDKWNIIWVIFIFLCFTPVVFSFYYYRLYRSRFDKHLNLFRYCTSIIMEQESEKVKLMIKMLNKNFESIYNYQFNVDVKEDYFLQIKQKADHDAKLRENKQSQQQLRNLMFLLGFFSIFIGWAVCFGLSIVSNTQIMTYFSKYKDTADTYKLLQDMTLYAGTLFRNRDFGLNFPNLPYLREYDHEKFYTTIYTGLSTINEFLQFTYSFDSTKYYTSQEFLDFFTQIQENPICDVLGQDYLGFMTVYCNTSLQGVLQQGYLSSLKFIYNTITSQMAMNNFTKRIEYNRLENEGGLIIMRTCQKMSTQFKQGMVDVTLQQIDISKVISLVFLFYCIILLVYIYFYLINSMKYELLLLRRFILMIPSTVLFLDDQFDRHVRILLVAQDQ